MFPERLARDSRRHKPGAVWNLRNDDDGFNGLLNRRVHGDIRLNVFVAVDDLLEHGGRIGYVRANDVFVPPKADA